MFCHKYQNICEAKQEEDTESSNLFLMVRLLLLFPPWHLVRRKNAASFRWFIRAGRAAAASPNQPTDGPTNVAGGAKTISRNGGANEQERGDRVVHVGRLGRELVCRGSPEII